METCHVQIRERGCYVWKYDERQKTQCMMGHPVIEEEFVAGELCVPLKVATGMPAPDGDDLAIVAFVFVGESA